MSDRKLILSLAVPAVLQTVVKSLFAIVDAFWVGKMGSLELASITVATFMVWGILALGEIIATGTNSMIAHSTGAEKHELSKEIGSLNIVNTFFHTIILAVVLIPLLPLFYYIMNLSAEQSKLAGEYLVTLIIGFPCITLLSTVTAIFRGYGDTKTPFYLLILAIVLNIFLAPLLIFGISGHFAFGMKGAAASSLVSYFISFVIGYRLLRKRDLTSKINHYKFDFKILKETLRIGMPVALNGIAFSLIYIFVSRFVADYGTVGFASLGIGHRSESLAYQITVGFGLASTILVGQSMGAKNTPKAERLAWKIFGVAAFAIIIYSAALFIFSREIAMIFSSDADVIKTASTYNRIAAIVQIFSAAEVIFGGAFAGAGDTLPTAVIGFPLNFLRIPLAAYFSYLWGLNGIWIAICLSVVLKGILTVIWFNTGRWKKRKTLVESIK
ncbi:MAG: MATE family efflux transporter [Ignavibacteriae bacterium]|nr:MATE family efflux transporter [Ignavibacteriota bacterium]